MPQRVNLLDSSTLSRGEPTAGKLEREGNLAGVWLGVGQECETAVVGKWQECCWRFLLRRRMQEPLEIGVFWVSKMSGSHMLFPLFGNAQRGAPGESLRSQIWPI
jgi:hypothetical protein